MSRRLNALAAIFVLFSGCATTPNVNYSYYPTRANSTLTLTQTIDCTSDKTQVVTIETPAVNTVYFADYSSAPYTFPIKTLDSYFADGDLSFDFTDDGRLKSINQSSTGQGETIVKSAITLATAAAALGGGAPRSTIPKQCEFLSALGGGKPVTLTYSNTIHHMTDDTGKPVGLTPTGDSQTLYDTLTKKKVLPILQFVATPSSPGQRVSYASESTLGDYVPLTLQETANVTLDVTHNGSTVWTTNIAVPTANTYTLPIPKAALFGTQKFTLTVNDAGAITAVEYGKTTGAADALNATTAAVQAATPPTAAQKASELQAEADLIAQQQRLLQCKAKPSACK